MLDKRNTEQGKKKGIHCQISHKLKQKDDLKIKQMDHIAMNFDSKILPMQ